MWQSIQAGIPKNIQELLDFAQNVNIYTSVQKGNAAVVLVCQSEQMGTVSQ